MIVAVHALLGAALGQMCSSRAQALGAGAVSHLVADALPHRDLEVPEEAVLLGIALAAVGIGRGWRSREFAGAIGGALPDLENLLARAADLPESRLLLPTHRELHGPKTGGFGAQIALAAACFGAMFLRDLLCADDRERGNSSR